MLSALFKRVAARLKLPCYISEQQPGCVTVIHVSADLRVLHDVSGNLPADYKQLEWETFFFLFFFFFKISLLHKASL